jgi:hypothetical protein
MLTNKSVGNRVFIILPRCQFVQSFLSQPQAFSPENDGQSKKTETKQKLENKDQISKL